MKKVVIFGISPAAIQSDYDFTTDTYHEVAAFTVDKRDIKESTLLGLPVVPFEEVESIYPPSEYVMFVAVYFHRVNQTRTKRVQQAKAKGYELVSYISSKAIVWPGLEIGENCMICDGAIVRPFTKVGTNTLIMPGATIGHDVVIGDNCYLAIRSVVLAGAKVESGCIIGANATILNAVTVAKDCVISAGVVIDSNTQEKDVYTVAQPILQPLPSDKMANILFKVQV